MRTYLRCHAKNCQEKVNVLESVDAVQAVKDQADQAYVVQRTGCQCQLSHLRSAQNVQRIKLQGIKINNNVRINNMLAQKRSRERLHSATGHLR